MNGRQILLLVRKDLRRRMRSPLATLLVLSLPLLLGGIMALAFGTGEPEIPKVKILLEDQDGGLAGMLVASAFGQGEAAKYFTVETVETGPGALERLEEEGFAALLRLPPGMTDALLEGKPVTLELVRNPAQSILPEVAELSSGVLAEALSAAAYVLREPLGRIRPLLETESAPPNELVAGISVSVNETLTRAGGYLFPPAITLKTVQLEKEEPAGEAGEAGDTAGAADPPESSVFLFVLPGLSVFALFTLGDMVMRDLLGEGSTGTLRRLLAGPVSAGTVVIAKALTAAAVAVIGLLILAGIAGAVSRRGVDPAGFTVLSFALVAAITGLAATVYGLARNERQGSTVASVLYLVLAFSGGSFIPLESLPAALRAIAPASLFYWGTEGYQELLLAGGGLRDVLLHAGILAGAGAATLALGGVLLRRRVLRGVV